MILSDFLYALIPAIESTCNLNSPVGCHVRGVKALEQLYSAEKKYVHTDLLMVPTLGKTFYFLNRLMYVTV